MPEKLPPESAAVLSRAWLAWTVFVAGLTVFGLITLSAIEPTRVQVSAWGMLAALWGLVVIAVLAAKSHVFKSAWERREADPDIYFRGLLSIWAVLQIGGVLGLLACFFSGSLLPGMLIAAVMLALTLAVRPSRAALRARPRPTARGVDAAPAPA